MSTSMRASRYVPCRHISAGIEERTFADGAAMLYDLREGRGGGGGRERGLGRRLVADLGPELHPETGEATGAWRGHLVRERVSVRGPEREGVLAVMRAAVRASADAGAGHGA